MDGEHEISRFWPMRDSVFLKQMDILERVSAPNLRVPFSGLDVLTPNRAVPANPGEFYWI